MNPLNTDEIENVMETLSENMDIEDGPDGQPMPGRDMRMWTSLNENLKTIQAAWRKTQKELDEARAQLKTFLNE